MSNTLYRKYRSKSLDQIIGQDHIKQVLKGALERKRYAHAYLFTGPRGTGKTSIARILAFEINGIAYDKAEQTHLDIIEIDAASNNSVDDVRELREKILIAPTTANYRVIIIDEVHMLSSQAFNALLKTLEEPPEHIIFILATTDLNKVPATIISRVHRLQFGLVEENILTEHFKNILYQEKIEFDEEALRLIAKNARGSVRDGMSLLDMASSDQTIVSLSKVQKILGISTDDSIISLVKAINNADKTQISEILNSLYLRGSDPLKLALQLYDEIKFSDVDNEKLLRLLTLDQGNRNLIKERLELIMFSLMPKQFRTVSNNEKQDSANLIRNESTGDEKHKPVMVDSKDTVKNVTENDTNVFANVNKFNILNKEMNHQLDQEENEETMAKANYEITENKEEVSDLTVDGTSNLNLLQNNVFLELQAKKLAILASLVGKSKFNHLNNSSLQIQVDNMPHVNKINEANNQKQLLKIIRKYNTNIESVIAVKSQSDKIKNTTKSENINNREPLKDIMDLVGGEVVEL